MSIDRCTSRYMPLNTYTGICTYIGLYLQAQRVTMNHLYSDLIAVLAFGLVVSRRNFMSEPTASLLQVLIHNKSNESADPSSSSVSLLLVSHIATLLHSPYRQVCCYGKSCCRISLCVGFSLYPIRIPCLVLSFYSSTPTRVALNII